MQAALVGKQSEMDASERLFEFEVVTMRHNISIPEQKGSNPLHSFGSEVPPNDRRDIRRLDTQTGEPARTVKFVQSGIVYVPRRVPQKIDVPGAEAVTVVSGICGSSEDAFNVLPERCFIQLYFPDD